MQLSLLKAGYIRVSRVIFTVVTVISLGAIALFTLALPAIASPGPVFIAQATSPTPVATPEPLAVPTPPAPASAPPNSDRQAEPLPTATENPPAPAPAKSPESQAGGPYDMEAIKEFYKSLYGS